ncbi:MAG TPA: glycosyltransferase [Hyphomicrobiaceae bacterium]|nr:glycosyltransferase [Hyphomicrobiaceae bacterium]
MASLLHRIWQLLPYRLRRRVLLAASAALAPRCARQARGAGPVFIAGFFSAASGLGELARLLYAAYEQQGAQVYGIDLSSPFRQGSDVRFDIRDGRAHRGEGTLILAVNAPFVALALMVLGRGFLAHKWRIGYWAWELPGLPREWRSGANLVNEIWAISSFSARAMEAGLGRPVRVVLPPVAKPRSPSSGATSSTPTDSVDLTVLFAFNMASSFARKNPLGAICAFISAFGHDSRVRLRVKIAHAHAFPPGLKAIHEACRGYHNIEVLAGSDPPAGLSDLLAQADVLLSLHRAEGLGLLFAQAMHLGKAIVATGWSGNLDLLTEDNAFLVPASLVPAHDPQGTYDWPGMLWAEPSVEAAAALLRKLRADPQVRVRAGRAARADAERLFCRQKLPVFPVAAARRSAREPGPARVQRVCRAMPQAGAEAAAEGKETASSLLPSGSRMNAPK